MEDRKALIAQKYHLKDKDDEETLAKNVDYVIDWYKNAENCKDKIYFFAIRKETKDIFDFTTMCNRKTNKPVKLQAATTPPDPSTLAPALQAAEEQLKASDSMTKHDVDFEEDGDLTSRRVQSDIAADMDDTESKQTNTPIKKTKKTKNHS